MSIHEALTLVLEEGLDARFVRHRQVNLMLKACSEKLGFSFASDPDHSLPTLSLANILAHVQDEAAVRRRLLNEFNLVIGGGLGKLAGKCWRIGLMGHGAHPENLAFILNSIEKAIAIQQEIRPG